MVSAFTLMQMICRHMPAVPTDQQMATTRLLACVLNIAKWMSSNRLKLNADKTEFIWLSTHQKLVMINVTLLHIGCQTINLVDKVRDLGVLTMNWPWTHVANIVRSCFYQLWQLRSVRQSLTINARHMLVSAFEFTTVMLSCKVSLQKSPDGYRWCSMPPLVSSLALASMTTSRRLFATFSTGCQYLRGLSSRSLFLHSTVSVVLTLPTSKMAACQCWILLLGAISVQLSVVTCLFLEQERQSSVDGVSRWLLRLSGIHYRLTYDHHW